MHRSQIVSLIALLTGSTALAAEISPEQKATNAPTVLRLRKTESGLRRSIHELKDPKGWPAEPESPAGTIDSQKFATAFSDLCRGLAARTVDLPNIAETIRRVAEKTETDAFLLGAIAIRQGLCTPTYKGNGGIGLLQIAPSMFPKGAALPFERSALDKDKLTDVQHNIEVGAALLKMWNAEHAALDERVGSTPHRSAVAHLYWGDRVWGATQEDRIFASRRRLLEHYGAKVATMAPSWFDFQLVSPLEGAPRLGTSGPGADREGGAREHRGLDVDAASGEPVRAVADGVIQFAGADMPGRQPARFLTVKRSRKYRGRFGPGGLFVRVMHTNQVRTGYFHLSSFTVAPGQPVKAGDVIGFVGRTGVKQSGAHLHFEVMQNGQLLDPVAFMSAFVLPPQATRSHEYAMAEKKVRLDKEKRARRRAYLRARRHLTS